MAKDKRPNVLIFCVDEMRADHMACAGNPVVKTPNIDRIAQSGTRFHRGYCNNPICMPARACMFTGLLPRDHGLRVNGQSLRKDIPVLPQILADNGYRTHAAGKLHLTPWVPKVDPPAPDLFPESLSYWSDELISEFPVPYYGFQTVDFVGGHTSYAYGPYTKWLEQNGGDTSYLRPEKALSQPEPQHKCYAMGIPEELHYNRYIADSAIQSINDAAKSPHPFFTWCSFPDPHVPVAPPAPYCHMYSPDDVQLPHRSDSELSLLPPIYERILSGDLKPNGTDNSAVTDAYLRSIIALTYGMITHIDTEIGRVIAALEHSGQLDNTVIVFISDHGDMMGDHGLLWKAFYTFKGCIKIPLIVSAPGMQGGVVSNALACQIDLLPTLLDLCDIPMPGADWQKIETPFERGAILPLCTYPGHSLRQVLDGSSTAVRKSVVIENDSVVTGYRVRSLVTRTHRITVYPGTGDGELFDLVTDPYELHNLWYDSENAPLRSELIAQLLDDSTSDTPFYPIPPWNS